MATADEIQRIAAAMNALRPDWRTNSLVTFLTKHHSGRAYRDLAIAGIAVATDTRTQTPHLLNEHGPWWVAAQAASGNTTEHRYTRCPEPGHTSFPANNCAACRSEKLAADDTQTAAPTLAITEDQAETNARWARIIRRQIAAHTETEEQS